MMKTSLKSLMKIKKVRKESKLARHQIIECIHNDYHQGLVFYHQLWSRPAFWFQEELGYLNNNQEI